MLSVTVSADGKAQSQAVGALGDYAGCAGTGPGSTYWATDGSRAPDSQGAIVVANMPKGPGLAAIDDNMVPIPYPAGWKGYVKFATIQDGLSNTIFFGEKYVHPDQYGLEEAPASVTASTRYRGDGPFYSGSNYHNATRTMFNLLSRFPTEFPIDPVSNLRENRYFGSAHPDICQFVFGDGSVRALPVTLTIGPLQSMAIIDDGNVIDFNF